MRCGRFIGVPVNSFQSFTFDLTVRFPMAGHSLHRKRFETMKKMVPASWQTWACRKSAGVAQTGDGAKMPWWKRKKLQNGLKGYPRLKNCFETGAPLPLTFPSRARYLNIHSKEKAHVHPN